MTRKAYIAVYPNPDNEIILAEDSYWSPNLRRTFDEAVIAYGQGGPLIQAWYCDEHQVVCLAASRGHNNV